MGGDRDQVGWVPSHGARRTGPARGGGGRGVFGLMVVVVLITGGACLASEVSLEESDVEAPRAAEPADVEDDDAGSGDERAFRVGRTPLEVGDCLIDPALAGQDWNPLAVRVVPCTNPHDAEVFRLTILPDFPASPCGPAGCPADAPYPGVEVMQRLMEQRCSAVFEHYVGAGYLQSALDFFAYVPTDVTWEKFGDRQAVCLVFDPFGELAEPVRGSGR
jgi:hypothetical protein